MNVLLCVNTLDYSMGGVSTHILDLCKQYSQMNEVNKVIVCCDGGEHIPALKEIKKVRYMEVPFAHNGMNLAGVWNSYRALWEGICNENIDIIHVHSQRILPVAHLIKVFHKIPYLWTNHIDAIPNPKVFRIMCRFMGFPIISVSQQLRNMMIDEYGCSPDRCYVVNNGTDLEKLQPLNEEERKALELNYHIDRSKTPYVICLLSRIVYVKGHMILLKAINKLPEKKLIKVIFAGHTYPTEVEYRQNLEAFSSENGIDAEFLDYSKPRDVFGVSDLFVLPSLYEGFALVCIEAFAMGCAVIRSRTPGWQEMQAWAEIVEKNDVDGLAEMIHKVINNGFNKEKTLAGQNAVLTIFTKENCAINTLNVYRRLLK